MTKYLWTLVGLVVDYSYVRIVVVVEEAFIGLKSSIIHTSTILERRPHDNNTNCNK